MKEEDAVNSDSAGWCVNFNMNFFNNTGPRAQIHGYLSTPV